VRIDHVLVRPGARKLAAKRTGAENSPLTPAGQFPSDHTGVFSRLRFPSGAPPAQTSRRDVSSEAAATNAAA
jgi:hypothetical protein